MRRPLELFFRVILVAFIALFVSMGAAYWFLQRDPSGLASHYLGALASEHGLSFSMDAADVNFLPSPSVSVSNVRIERDDLSLAIAYLTVRPNLFALLRGKFSPWGASLVRPRLELRLDEAIGDPDELLQQLQRLLPKGNDKASSGPLSFLTGSCRLEISQGDARINGADGASIALHGLQCRLKGAPPGEANGFLRFTSLRYARQNDILASVEHFRLEGESDLAAPLTATPKAKLSATLKAQEWPGSASLSLSFQGKPGGWNSSFAFTSDLALGGPAGEIVPLQLAGTAALPNGAREIDLRGVQLALGADSGRLDGVLRLPDATQGLALKGSLLLNRLSLTQWLGFARNLAPGLQLALDNITDASIDFLIDANGLKAPRISAVCTGARFSGSGGVPSWQKPEVQISLKAESVNLGLAIPEAVAKPPQAASFSHPPLTPLPGEPLKPGETGIGYDIRLSADKVRYGPVLLTQGSTRIHPGKLDKNGLEDVLIDAEGRFYEGNFRGQCILGGSQNLPYAITAQLRGVNGEPLAQDMPILPFRSGRFRADVSIQSQGRDLDVFLGHLRGVLNIRGEQGSLEGSLASRKIAFSRLDADCSLRSGIWRSNRLGLDGVWKVRLENADLDGSANLDGKLWFGSSDAGAGMEFQKVASSGNLNLKPEFSGLPNALRATWRAQLGCQSARKRLALNGLQLETLGMSLTGDLALDGASSSISGHIEAQSPDLARSLQLMGMEKMRLPVWLRSFSLAGELSARPESISLGKISAKTPELNATGSLSLSRRQGRPFLEFALTSEALDLERLADGKRRTREQPKGGTWEAPFMRKFDARGELRIHDLGGWRFHLRDLVMPITLASGKLTLGPGKGRFYGATLHSRSNVDFRSALAFDTSLSVTAFDLGAATRDRKLDSSLTGLASIEATISARDLGPGRLPAALNGNWSCSVQNGSYQSLSKSGEPKGQPTRFSSASASGTIKAGIARSDNLRIQGPTLNTAGKGSLNLVNKTIDCNFTVNMRGLPEFPLRIYGSMDKPKTSIGAGKLIINTITGLTSGIVDVLGGIVEGAWRIFR